MEDLKKKKLNMKVQWTKFAIVMVLYIAFLVWLKSWLGIIVIPFIYDVYITKKIKWQWWKDAEGPVRFVMSWVDALVFALVAVYFINLFFFQNYVIPSSSLEKSLLTGDYLFVSKVSYGPRIPETPLTMPLTQHTLPVNLLGDVNVEDERNHNESQPAFYPNQKEEIEGENHSELCPLYLHIEFLFLLVYHNFCLELK